MAFSVRKRGRQAGECREVFNTMISVTGAEFCGRTPFSTKTFNGPHPFFNYQQTSEGRDGVPTSIPTHRIINMYSFKI